ncbi:MAG TPA: pyridoxal-phosphate dependent enzyme [Verrucomicrobiales bacterium]|nr:pyridoxal-phosphate dependent enzyme [Verrucomicrobiales bacterium]
MTDAIYDLTQVQLYDSSNPYQRFRDLLPIHNPGLMPNDAAYTPTVHAQRLGEVIGLPKLYLKDDTKLPTGTTKDRMAAVALAYLFECGVQSFCTSSTGNSSTAYAQALTGFPDFRMYLFTAENFQNRVQYRDNPHIVHYLLRDATFAEAFEASGAFAKMNRFVSERGFFNLGRREGLKISWLEAVDQIDGPIDWYVQAVSSAMGVYGAYKGGQEMRRLGRLPRPPRLLCVQQSSCAPMVRAWEEGAESILPEHIVHNPQGIAKAILRGDPSKAYPIMRKIVLESEGVFTAVEELEIREARAAVEELEGISPCFSASTAVAGLMKLARLGKIPANHTVLINLTGRNRTPSDDDAAHQDRRWLKRSAGGWIPEDPEAGGGLVYGNPAAPTKE